MISKSFNVSTLGPEQLNRESIIVALGPEAHIRHYSDYVVTFTTTLPAEELERRLESMPDVFVESNEGSLELF